MDQPNNQPSIDVPPAFYPARSALPDEVVIIARWEDESSRSITIQDFTQNGRPFIPVFLDRFTFNSQIKGSGFEDQGVCIKTDLLLSILKGGERLIVNPGGELPQAIDLPEL
jgi:hypothetical protein